MKLDPRTVSVDAHPHHDFGPASFDELMAEQLRHTPWLALSIAIHALVIGLFLMVPAHRYDSDGRVALVLPVVEEQVVEDEEPIVDEVQPDEPAEEPVLQDVEIAAEDLSDLGAEEFANAFDDTPPLDATNWNTALGLGGGGGGQGKFGMRSGGRRGLRAKGGHDTARAIELGLEWLKQHQDPDGRWDADGFMMNDADADTCDGAGNPVHDVGVTGLALLAFLGDGSTMRTGPYRQEIVNGISWLRHQQDNRGLFGADASRDYIYDHAIGTLAMVEAYGLSEYRILRKYAQRGIDYLELHRNPGGVWRYQPASNSNDTSVTGWAVLAYKSAQDFGLHINEDAMTCALEWFDAVTDPETGRCGYTRRGEGSSRHPGDHVDRFPLDRGEALTGVGLMCRFFLGQDPRENPVMRRAADRLLEKPPVWNADDGSIDHYYWYYGTYALYQMGNPYWREWSRYVTKAVVKTQRADGPFRGSWDPIGVWGEDGGRIYSTATLILTLEAYYRYTRVLVR